MTMDALEERQASLDIAYSKAIKGVFNYLKLMLLLYRGIQVHINF